MNSTKKRKKSRKNKISITAIRDWAGFILTVAGIWLSLSNRFYMDMHFYYYIEVIDYNNLLPCSDDEYILK